VPDTIVKLAATTFAQPVEAKMLAVMVPLLIRGLRERNTAIKRQTAVIITNMTKLVENPADLAAFMPQLLPEVDKVGREISDPNARSVAVTTHALLVQAAGSEDGRAALEAERARHATPEVSALRPCLHRLFDIRISAAAGSDGLCPITYRAPLLALFSPTLRSMMLHVF
jgi:elongation factor 3